VSQAPLPASQRDIRWLFAQAKARSLPAPDGGQATAFAERVAIMVHDAGLPEGQARAEAAKPLFEELRNAK